MPVRKISQLKLILIMTVFLFPVLMGSLLYHYRQHFAFKTLNRGVLVNPPLNISDLWSSTGKWQIVLSPKNCCDAKCEETMFLMHQLRLVLGNDSRRIDLVVAVNHACPEFDIHDLRKVSLQNQQLQKIASDKIYLVDPHDNLFMTYDGSTDLMNIYKDLKRVLEVSQIG